MKYLQGDIFYFDLNPSKGIEMQKKRPCLIVSNNNYNRIFNTVVVVPISSSQKYFQKKYVESPLFAEVKSNSVSGTILLQHLRSIDPQKRIEGKRLAHLSEMEITKLSGVIKEFF